MVPVTPLGKVIAGIVALIGVGLFALPAGLLASGFIEEVNRNKEEKKRMRDPHDLKAGTCPHCGKDLHEPPIKKEE